MSDAPKYLKFMTRHGLDTRVLQEFSQYGLLYCSRRYDHENADICRFVDYEGFNRKLIRKVDELEAEFGYEFYHIIQNNADELILMYHDPDLDFDYQINRFKQGSCIAIKYSVPDDTWSYFTLNYEVRLGAVVDVDFMNNM